ncbi:MAG: DUF262 domain-containing protein [Elusimicrobiales bacterium]|nr:DUF262 domain-containing protein [Elusimicrobiales bacterium]
MEDLLENPVSLKKIFEYVIQNQILLPTVQRGFVWKPYQIENLWDSLLRRYPIGSFVIHQKKNGEGYELLDGQQRVSAICLGFCDPDKQMTSTFLKVSAKDIMIFIDLYKPNEEYDRKYIFRVITKSHPWGYQKRDNKKILKSQMITEAIQKYGLKDKENYLEKNLDSFWPYDASIPVPFEIFINSALQEDPNPIGTVLGKIEKWRQKTRWTNDKQKGERSPNKEEEKKLIEEIYLDVKKMMEKQKIPIVYLEIDEIYGKEEVSEKTNLEDEKTQGEEDDDDEDQQQNSEERIVDEVENLFIRLNSGGTPLRGEELNYSVLKANIETDIQKNIEDICKGFCYPSRFITIAFRLFECKSDPLGKDSIKMRIKPKQFYLAIKNEKEGFVNFLKDYFFEKDSKPDILKRLKDILTYDEEKNEIGLPIFMVNSLADRAPEVVFILLYRMLIKEDFKENDTLLEELKPKILGITTLFIWLGRGENQKDLAKLLEKVWPGVKNMDTKRFWSKDILDRAMLIMTPFPKRGNCLKTQNKDIRNFTRDKLTKNEKFGDFIDKMFWNNYDLLLYAQRASLHKWFSKTECYDLDDTNRPFDWDHILPKKLIKNKKDIKQALKDLYWSNGNLRAWPYGKNRSDSDKCPKLKLKDKKDENILKESFCEKKWLKLGEKLDPRNNSHAKKMVETILQRNIDLCQEWYDKLAISSLYTSKLDPQKVKKSFISIFKKGKWKRKRERKRNYDNDKPNFYLPLDKNNISICIWFDDDKEILEEDNVSFGFYGYKKDMKEDDKLNIKKDENKIYGRFTLLSFSNDAILGLLKEFYNWLKNFPDNEIRESALKKYEESIKSDYKKNVVPMEKE